MSKQANRRDDAFDRLAPHSLECEMCTLAAMLLDRKTAERIMGGLNADDFFLKDNQIIFETIRTLIEASRPVDAIILRDELKQSGKLNAIGGAGYIAKILDSLPTFEHGIEYARRVHEKSLLRFLIGLADTVTRRAYGGTDAGARIARDAVEEITKRTKRKDAHGNGHASTGLDRTAGALAEPARELPPASVRRPVAPDAGLAARRGVVDGEARRRAAEVDGRGRGEGRAKDVA